MLNFKGGPKVMNIYNHKEQYSVQHINIGSHSYALLRHFHIQESNKSIQNYLLLEMEATQGLSPTSVARKNSKSIEDIRISFSAQ
jgi:hypothetical protein